MKYGDLLEFRKDLYFEGAVQIDWFYDQTKASKVAENFVFHGKDYFGAEDSFGGKKRIDTISLVRNLTDKLNDETIKVPSLAIADYGTGKSHLAVTLGQLFSGSAYMPETFNFIIENIKKIDEESAQVIKDNCDSRNFVMVINGMRDFNLHSEILRAAQRSLALYGLPDDNLRKLNRALQTAQLFFERNAETSIEIFENAAKVFGWSEKGDRLKSKINNELLTNEVAFEIVNSAYKEITGQEIRWDEGLSASVILDMLISEYCGMNGSFDHVIILFDEFGRYLEYASGVSAAKSGDSALQQIFESVQNADGTLQVINFIQSDIKTYLQRVDQTKNISRYIGRYDGSDKYYISSNLETVFANLIQRKDKAEFSNQIISWQEKNEAKWKSQFLKLNKWLITKGLWKEYETFRKVVVEGIYPMHPLSTFMLTQLSDYLQNRSSLTLISQYIEDLSETSISKEPLLIMPEQLMSGDLYVEMLAAEQDGKQPSQQCIKYDNILRKFGDKLSEKSLSVLRANLILRILRFRTTDYDDAKSALSFASGLSVKEVEEELVWLENEYAVLGFDDHADVFDFMEESNGAHDFKIIKKRLIAAAHIENTYISDLKIQEIVGIQEPQNTNFGTLHKIATNEWKYKQELYRIEDFTEIKAKQCVDEWRHAIGSTTAKGKLIWLYMNKDSEPDCLEKSQELVHLFVNMPIVVMLINDEENRLFNYLTEYYVFDNMDDLNRKKYERHFTDGFAQAERNIKDEFEELKKKRLRILPDGTESLKTRMAAFLTNTFEEIYPNAVSFWFDSFITKGNNLGGKGGTYYCSIIKMLLSGTVNQDSIHNFSSDVRNRIDAVLMHSANTSWKCISDNYRIIPPEEKRAKAVYDKIVSEITDNRSKRCSEIFDEYSKPPYGMSEDIITLMIAVICANLNYCLRFEYQGEVHSINNWKELVIIKDKKIKIDVIRQSTFIMVDAGEVVTKFQRLFTRIHDNRMLSEVPILSYELTCLTESNEVPEEIESEYFLAKNILDTGRRAKNTWEDAVGDIEDSFYVAEAASDFYRGLTSMEKMADLSIDKYFSDNGFDFDENSKSRLQELKLRMDEFVDENIDDYIDNMYCKSIEAMNTFRNHNTKIQKKLSGLGFDSYARLVEAKKNSELENREEIKSRQELREDYRKYLESSRMDRYISYVAIKDWIKEGKELLNRVEKFQSSLGGDGPGYKSVLIKRLDDLEKQKAKIEEDISVIWDGLMEIKCPDDIKALISQIGTVLQKGLSPADQEGLEEIKENLEELIEDVKDLAETDSSRKEFFDKSSYIREKYADSEFDFEVMEIIDGVIEDIDQTLQRKDSQWKKQHLSLGDKSRKSVHHWKSSIEFLPEYLSDDTLIEIKKLDKVADELIKEGKMEDVFIYFEKLNETEKRECLKKLCDSMNLQVFP